MTAFVRNIAFDCADPYALALFWSAVTGSVPDPECEPDDDAAVTTMANGTRLYFARVPEPKQVKNRMHLCLQPYENRDAEVDRLLALGASMHEDRRNPDGTGWAVLTDPEGNEFCMVRSAEEYAHTPPGE
jgi:predicted enzyme related to lactoylglutathione lyase